MASISIPRAESIDITTLPIYENNPLEELRDIAGAKGGALLSTVYINRTAKMRWRCAEGHEWVAPAQAIKNARQWCPRCGIKRRSDAQRLTIDDMRALARSKGGEFLSATYRGVHFKHLWRCNHGHEWNAEPSNVKNRSWCPTCAALRNCARRVVP